jgi:DNA-directed RNA polymerase subunit K/omega
VESDVYSASRFSEFWVIPAKPSPKPLSVRDSVVHRPADLSAFEFAVLAGLRAAQLARGCTPRVACAQKIAVTAQIEIAERKVVQTSSVPVMPIPTA